MAKLPKDNKIKNQKIQNLQIIKTKQKIYSHYCETISVKMESFSKFFFLIQFFLIYEKFGSNIFEHFEGANNIGFQHNL